MPKIRHPLILSGVKPFGTTFDNQLVECITLTNRSRNNRGIEVDLINLGASIHRIRAPDQQGRLDDIVLYCEDVEHYQTQKAYLGATIGRYANRIGGAAFNLNGQHISLLANEGCNQLHGGADGFDKRLWVRQNQIEPETTHVQFRLVSSAGDQGFPGRLKTTIDYQLTQDNRLIIDIRADTTEATVVNLTNHAYFNLSGSIHADLHEHYFNIPSVCVCAVDDQQIPTGTIENIRGSVLDLHYPTNIQQLLDNPPAELYRFKGFDHTYVFNNDDELKHLATVSHLPSARKVSLFSTQPGLQFYTGNNLAEAQAYGPGGAYQAHGGFCLEAQHLPDSPNHDLFPSTRLVPGQLYHQQIIYRFGLV
jgi:aldose 1-epimerase